MKLVVFISLLFLPALAFASSHSICSALFFEGAGKVLSASGLDIITTLDASRILRQPRYGDGLSIDEYLDGAKALKAHQIPIPEILEFERRQWIVVEAIDIQYRMEDLFLRGETLPDDLLEKIKAEFMVFVANFRSFDLLSDLHSRQIVYARDRGWILLDWGDRHIFGSRVNPFMNVWEDFRIDKKNSSGKKFDLARVRQWRLESDDVIARERHQPARDYRSQTYRDSRNLLASKAR